MNKSKALANTSFSYPLHDLTMALKVFGGFVRYYHSTESLLDLSVIAQRRPFKRALACCGGGDQILTLLGVAQKGVYLDAVDINAAQLFTLAAKAQFIKQHKKEPFYPSFQELLSLYPDKVFTLPSDLRMTARLYDQQKRVFISAPKVMQDRFLIEVDNGTFDEEDFRPFWAADEVYISHIRANIKGLRFLKADILDAREIYSGSEFDLLYLSDIAILHATTYHLEQLRRLLSLVKAGGIIIGSGDQGDNFLSKGASFIEIMRDNARSLCLREIETTKMHVVLQRD